MSVSLIAAMAQNRVIGKGNELPWSIPEDLKFFKEMTLGKTVIMGRKTYESMGRPLPKRMNIVLSRSEALNIEGVTHFQDLKQAIHWAESTSEQPEVMIIGGQQIYELAIPLADRIYLTIIEKDFEGDASFPTFDESLFERQLIRHSQLEDLHFSFFVYERIATS